MIITSNQDQLVSYADKLSSCNYSVVCWGFSEEITGSKQGLKLDPSITLPQSFNTLNTLIVHCCIGYKTH